VPVAHAYVDGRASFIFEEFGLAEGPVGEGRPFGQRLLFEADLGVAVLELLDDVLGHGAAAGDVTEVFRHLAEPVGCAVREEKDGGLTH
jgi:hypothetical protein